MAVESIVPGVGIRMNEVINFRTRTRITLEAVHARFVPLRRASQQTEASNSSRSSVVTGVASFLEDALNSKSANQHLRRANMLVMGKQVCCTTLWFSFACDGCMS